MHVYVYTYTHVQVSGFQSPLTGTSVFRTTHITVIDILSAEDQIWICKPSCSNQGRGIFLLKNPAAVNTLQAKLHSTEENLLNKRVPYKAPQARIVQR